MTKRFAYRVGAELPGLTLPWQEEVAQDTFADLDLSAYTFELTLVHAAGTVALTKSTGITGAVGAVSIVWVVGELDIAPGRYNLRLRATETATGKDRDYWPNDPPVVQIV